MTCEDCKKYKDCGTKDENVCPGIKVKEFTSDKFNCFIPVKDSNATSMNDITYRVWDEEKRCFISSKFSDFINKSIDNKQ